MAMMIGTGDALKAGCRATTAERLEATARRLSLQRGYARVTVEDIASAAGVSPRTFFRYFSSKADVVFAHQWARVRAVEAALSARPSTESVIASVHAALSELAQVYAEERDRDLIRTDYGLRQMA